MNILILGGDLKRLVWFIFWELLIWMWSWKCVSCLWDNPIIYNFVICGLACPVKAYIVHLSKPGVYSSGFSFKCWSEERTNSCIWIQPEDPAGRDALLRGFYTGACSLSHLAELEVNLDLVRSLSYMYTQTLDKVSSNQHFLFSFSWSCGRVRAKYTQWSLSFKGRAEMFDPANRAKVCLIPKTG